MLKCTLDDLLRNGVLSKNEYDEFFKYAHVNESGEMIGFLPHSAIKVYAKYCFNGDLLGSDLLDFVLNNIGPPIGAESFDECFRTYGISVCGISDGWKWFRKGDISDYALQCGHKPIEDATTEELWKMIAIASRYWEVFYDRCYHELKKNFEG